MFLLLRHCLTRSQCVRAGRCNLRRAGAANATRPPRPVAAAAGPGDDTHAAKPVRLTDSLGRRDRPAPPASRMGCLHIAHAPSASAPTEPRGSGPWTRSATVRGLPQTKRLVSELQLLNQTASCFLLPPPPLLRLFRLPERTTRLFLLLPPNPSLKLRHRIESKNQSVLRDSQVPSPPPPRVSLSLSPSAQPTIVTPAFFLRHSSRALEWRSAQAWIDSILFPVSTPSILLLLSFCLLVFLSCHHSNPQSLCLH